MYRIVFAMLSLLVGSRPYCQAAAAEKSAPPAKPNILWITCEDIGPQLGCYGDKYADTPNLDKLAARGLLYRHAWSNAPVCAPARTTIISGMYPTSTGAEHMRSMVPMPKGTQMYPQLLRAAGYYCTNNSKEDYNLNQKKEKKVSELFSANSPPVTLPRTAAEKSSDTFFSGKVWDDSSNKAHWKNRAAGQPFFAIFNNTVTHESQIHKRPHKAVHDPAKVRVPAYHPDTREVRQDWAQYYDNITTMDAQAGRLLNELQAAGLADDTIVFFYGDHGSGMPRSKRWPYNSGLHVPLIVSIPPKFAHLAPKDYATGGQSDRLVSFVDLAPTLVSLAGVKPPAFMQGHAFLGPHAAPPQPYVYGFRGRMDERYDMVRTVRDQRYVYVRNYMPHLIYGQHVAYMFETPTTQVWKRLFDQGKLTPAQSHFWQKKPPEELYDLKNDPDEVNNLAGSAEHREILERMRKAEQDWIVRVRDVGFLPEPEIHRRSEGSTPYDMGHDDGKYPMARIVAAAELASGLKADAVPALKKALADADSAVRYWGAMGLLMRGTAAVEAAHGELQKALADAAPCVRLAAASALSQCGTQADLDKALPVLVDLAPTGKHGVNVSLMALNAIEALGPNAASALPTLKKLAKQAKGGGRTQSYDARVFGNLLDGKRAGRPRSTPIPALGSARTML